jgi:hypothetical protein
MEETAAERRRRQETWALTPTERLTRGHALMAMCFAEMSPAGRRHFLARNHRQRRKNLPEA